MSRSPSRAKRNEYVSGGFNNARGETCRRMHATWNENAQSQVCLKVPIRKPCTKSTFNVLDCMQDLYGSFAPYSRDSRELTSTCEY